MQTVTQWFHGENPEHIGVYERDISETPLTFAFASPTLFSYWNGKRWGLGDKTPEIAMLHMCEPSGYQTLPWRGLAEEPEASK
jgi:hypothetical protein